MWKRLEQVKAAAAEKEAKSPKKQQRRNSAGPRLHKLLDAVGVPENLPEAATPASLTCQPKSYQLQVHVGTVHTVLEHTHAVKSERLMVCA